jgi:hypothetical protein
MVRFSNAVIIERPRDRVIELFDDPKNLLAWMPDLKSFEPVSGTPGQPGAVSKLTFDQNGRRFEMTETITARSLPREFSGVYETSFATNRIRNVFEDLGPKTRWIQEAEFEFRTWFIRTMAWFMPGAFRKVSLGFMTKFKEFAESR